MYDAVPLVAEYPDYGESIGVAGRQHLRCLGMQRMRVDHT